MGRRMLVFGALALVALLGLTGCGSYYREIPAGYVGKMLTPTGWDQKTLEAGQVDLGKTDNAGRYTVLVLVEATSTTVKEQFLGSEVNPDKEDHRILTKDGAPLTVDLYVRVMLPDSEKDRNALFVQITPKKFEADPRVKVITLGDVYERFARMDIRGKVRGIFAGYAHYRDVYVNYDEINKKISAMVLETFKENGVPLRLQNAQLSNVKPDQRLWDAENKKAAAAAEASAINTIGEAMRKNPDYGQFLKWQSLQKIAETGSTKGTNTIIIADGGSDANAWAAAEYLRQQLSTEKK